MVLKTYHEKVSKYLAAFSLFIPDKTPGVYFIESRATQNTYIGCSSNILSRMFVHLKSLRNKSHPNLHLQRHYDKHGEADLVIGYLELCPKEVKLEREKFWVDELDTFKNGFNRCEGGGGATSPETIAAMTAGRNNPGYRAGVSERLKGQMAKLSTVQRSALGRHASKAFYGSLTLEQLSGRNKHAAKMRWAKPNQSKNLSAKLKTTLSKVPQEEKTSRALKAWATRRAKKAGL